MNLDHVAMLKETIATFLSTQSSFSSTENKQFMAQHNYDCLAKENPNGLSDGFLNVKRTERETERLEAFSDAVFAFAITLLVLNLYDPTTRGSSLFQGLLEEWPAFFAFAVSFISILVMWINHHNMFNYIKRLSREFMLLNGLLLMFVVLYPFTTLLASEHLLQSDARVAAVAYCLTFFVLSTVWNLAWHNASHHHNLIDESIPPSQIQRITRENIVAPITSGISVVLAFIIPIASITLIFLISVYYAITVTGGERFSRGSSSN